jgi:aryl-alcohol dehydrogenase-like predicted oxidoreductase
MGMSHGYGKPADKAEMRKLIAQAVDLGCTLFDTAETYGTPERPHDNEELVGEALAPYRDRVRISTKFGISFDWDDGRVNHAVFADSRPKTIRASVEGSLRRLRTDHIDVYIQHRQDPDVPVEEVAGVMADLISEGKILGWGVSEVDAETVRRAHAACPLTVVQNRYSMMARWHEPLFDVCEELGIGFMAFSPLANGLLSGKIDTASFSHDGSDYRTMMPQFAEENRDHNKELIELVGGLAQRHDCTPAQVSLAWMICKRPFIVPIPGTRKASRLTENLGAADVILSPEEIAAIDAHLDAMDIGPVYGGTTVKK